MPGREPGSPIAWTTGLSARLLALTVVFIMISEVLIYVPSVARYRRVFLETQIEKAHLAVLALEATPNAVVDERLEKDLLQLAGAVAVALKEPDRRVLMLGGTARATVHQTIDLDRESLVDGIVAAFRTLIRAENGVIRLIGPSSLEPDDRIEVLLPEAPLRRAIVAYSWRILTVSILISVLTAALVYLALHWLMVRPVARLTQSLVLFRENPEDDRATLPESTRSDEIGRAQRELVAMQRELRGALRQKTRLALLGAAVAKINHDLRNTLATAALASDHLTGINDPEVKRVMPQLYGAIDRAIALCARTLDFVHDDRPPVRSAWFDLDRLLAEVAAVIRRPRADGKTLPQVLRPSAWVEIDGDRDQLFRVFVNLLLNAAQAGAATVRVLLRLAGDRALIDIIDDGPGLPEKVRERLFTPFAGSGRSGGSGLGLVIAREIIEAHGGTIEMSATGPEGTAFRVALPASRVRLKQQTDEAIGSLGP